MLYEVLNFMANVTGKLIVRLSIPESNGMVDSYVLEDIILEENGNHIILSGISEGENKEVLLDPDLYRYIEAFTESGGYLLDVKDAEFFHGKPYDLFFSNDGMTFDIGILVKK